ncbi:MAG: response regulator, partial [Phycisphaerales bacterium]|nr:response regulator [Phycisphaerales bacterium]
INDILDIAKIESGHMDVHPTEVVIRDLVQEVVTLHRANAASRGSDIQISISEETPVVMPTDAMRLRQILSNLVSNAIKFGEGRDIRVRVATEPGLVHFEVEDQGIGIAQADLDHLFESFSQVDSTMTRSFGGTGLGLAISRRLAGLLGGRLAVESSAGRGSTFRLTLDPNALEAADDSRHRTASKATLTSFAEPIRILVAEDGVDNQRLIRHLLTRAGATVTVVANGRDAVDAALSAPETPFDVILMDMQMPIMDGFEATRALRTRGWTKPIIALTAHALSSDHQKCLDAGCDDYLRKPIDRVQLVSACSARRKASRPAA